MQESTNCGPDREEPIGTYQTWRWQMASRWVAHLAASNLAACVGMITLGKVILPVSHHDLHPQLCVHQPPRCRRRRPLMLLSSV